MANVAFLSNWNCSSSERHPAWLRRGEWNYEQSQVQVPLRQAKSSYIFWSLYLKFLSFVQEKMNKILSCPNSTSWKGGIWQFPPRLRKMWKWTRSIRMGIGCFDCYFNLIVSCRFSATKERHWSWTNYKAEFLAFCPKTHKTTGSIKGECSTMLDWATE